MDAVLLSELMLNTFANEVWILPHIFLQMVKVGIVEQTSATSGKKYVHGWWLPAPKHYKDAPHILAYWQIQNCYCSLKYCFHPQETLMMQHHWAPRCSPPPLLKYHPRSKRRHPHRLPLPPSTPASVLTGIKWCCWRAIRWYEPFCWIKIKRFVFLLYVFKEVEQIDEKY